MTPPKLQRYVVRPIALEDGTRAHYVADTALGYCTDPTTKADATRDARQRNNNDEQEQKAKTS